jgi:hypothetical protein
VTEANCKSTALCQNKAIFILFMLAALSGCGVRPGIFCSSDVDCAGGVCIEGLCTTKDAGGDPTPSERTCDGGSSPCLVPVSGSCWQGSRSCESGVLRDCVPLTASADINSCGPLCEACGLTGDRCEQGVSCKCGAGLSCARGQRCVGGTCFCDSTSCSAGCCDAKVCKVPSTVSCGTGGTQCQACDLFKADRCSAAGQCACGNGPPCSAGQRCSGGACICDGSSCATGCCADNVCKAPSTITCGTGGAQCKACDLFKADRCSAVGQCACGNGSACATGQHCVNGNCICDGSSCPSGCCDGPICQQRSFSRCGTNGSGCVSCDLIRGDNCSVTGQCACGSGPPCSVDSHQRCSSGTCICDGPPCTGCCQGSECVAGNTTQQCGNSGSACYKCEAGERCNGRVCVCTPPCL